MRYKSDARVCRENGWGVGTVVSGVCPYKGEVEIRITAIGEANILARRKNAMEEHTWYLADWADVKVKKKHATGPAPMAASGRNKSPARSGGKAVGGGEAPVVTEKAKSGPSGANTTGVPGESTPGPSSAPLG